MGSRLVMAFAIATFVVSPVEAQTQGWYFVKLPVPPGTDSIVDALGLDATGNAVGNAVRGQQNVPVKWPVSGPAVILPDVGTGPNADGKSYSATGLNSVGGVSGIGVDSTGTSVGIYWDPTGTPHPLQGAEAIGGVSDSGMVVGQIFDPIDPNNPGLAAIWQDYMSGQSTVLPMPDRFLQCPSGVSASPCYDDAAAISPDGKYVAGLFGVETSQPPDSGILWVNAVPANNYIGTRAYAAAATDAGIVVGEFDTGLPPENAYISAHHAYIWQAGTWTDLGTLPGATADDAFESGASAINAGGEIVGYSQFITPIPSNGPAIHAVIWRNGQIADLNSVLASRLPAHTTLLSAIAITDDDQILLWAQDNITSATSYLIAKPIIATSINITSNLNPSSYGQQIHLVAKITPASGAVPQGLISWYDNGTLVGTARVTNVGTASWEPSTWVPGAHNVTAKYAEFDPDGPSASSVFKQTVKQTTTRTTVLTSANPAIHGALFTLTATVLPAYGTIAGSVTFKSGTTSLGTAPVNARTKQARVTTSMKAAGKYAITAAYGGNPDFLPSTSQTLQLTVK